MLPVFSSPAGPGRKERRRAARSRGRRRGAAAVEFALVLPFMILLVFGMIEFSRAMLVQSALTTSARSGARLGAFPNSNYDDVKAAVDKSLQNEGFDATKATVDVYVIDKAGVSTQVTSNATFKCAEGSQVRVGTGLQYNDVSWLPWGGWFLKDRMLVEYAVFRVESPKFGSPTGVKGKI